MINSPPFFFFFIITEYVVWCVGKYNLAHNLIYTCENEYLFFTDDSLDTKVLTQIIESVKAKIRKQLRTSISREGLQKVIGEPSRKELQFPPALSI